MSVAFFEVGFFSTIELALEGAEGGVGVVDVLTELAGCEGSGGV
jgi:hypothetical protein